MTDPRWQRVKALFQATVERPPSERAAFLAAAADGDDALRREVESLLDSDSPETEFADRLAFRDRAPLALESLLQASGRAEGTLRIGPYRILREIGRGGMAAVYLAVRDDGEYRKDVAIKVVQDAFASDFIVRRFRQERQILAGLEHQNIARLLDGGSTDDDLPYLVMELVAGSPIDEYCDEHQLSLADRLALFCDVCSAVSYAHERFVIHRDLKPSNILVTADGTPKLLDFGIAKLLDGSEDMADRTVTGLRMMTPEYASPEQIRGEPVGVPTDVYALGVLLYRLVTARSPYRKDTDRPHELARAICEDEPELPSVVLRRLHSNAHAQQTGDLKTGDLDAIVMKALAKEPEGRYTSVERFADDVRRYLDRRPISAPRATRARRAWKVMGRNRSRSLAAACLLFVMVVLTISVGSRFRTRGAADRVDARPMSVKPLTTLGQTVGGPAFSPDGNVIAFSWIGESNQSREKPGIFTMSVAGSTPTRITSGAGGEQWPAWSPDGSQIAFVRSEVPGQCGIFLVPARGGPERKLLALRDDRYYWLAWSPDGKHLAFTDRDSPQNDYFLSLLSVDTLERRRLPVSALRFAFSPDGRTLAFIGRGPDTLVVSLFSLSDGTTRSIHSQREWIGGLAWTADGLALVLSLNQHGSRRLAKLPIAGGALELLPLAGEDAYYPTVSRRGDRLAFVREVSDTDLWRIELHDPLAPGRPTPLIRSTRDDSQPSFSPDGKRIAFQSDRSGSFEIWVSNADGSHQVQLTSLGGPPASSPGWSPDGQDIAFWSDALYVVHADGGPPRRFNAREKGGELPAWSTDGGWLYVTAGTDVWRVPANEGHAVQVTKNGGYAHRESRDGRHLYYTKREPGIWRVPVSGGQETRVIEAFPNHLAGYWDVVDEGIYFADDTTSPYPTIRFFDFASRRTTPVAALAGPAVPWEGRLTVSPDRRSIVYTQSTYARSEIMLVENFR